MIMPRSRFGITTVIGLLGGVCLLLVSQPLDAGVSDPGAEVQAVRRPWNVLVESDNASLQRLALTGIVHWQHAWLDSSDGNGTEDEFRRFRFGADARFLGNFRFAGKVNFNPDGGRFYKSLSRTYLSYSSHGNRKEDFERARLSVGKLKPHFSNEHTISPKRIKTFERSLLPNQLNPLKSTGVFVGRSGDRFSGSLAVYSGEDSEEFGGVGEGLAVIAKGAYDPVGPWRFGLDYLGVWEDVETTPWVGHALSISAEYAPSSTQVDWSLMAELIGGFGTHQQSDVFGLVLLASCRSSEHWEFVARYQFAASSEPDGLWLQKRYERTVVPGPVGDTGDEYHAVYCGVNYLIAGDALKLMAGIEYSFMNREPNLRDFDAVTCFGGFRCYF